MKSTLPISALFVLFSLVIAVGGCGGNSVLGQPAPGVTLSAQPSAIAVGSSSTLSWMTSNATSVDITGVGSVAPNGSIKVSPSSTTTYTATVKGPGGAAKASATVTVGSGQAPSITLSAQPSTIAVGGSSTLGWVTSNATSVDISGFGNEKPDGSIKVVPTSTTTYTATASGPGGSTKASATVTVSGGVAQFGHVFLLVEENHSYSSVIGNSSMPYLDRLAKQYGLATQYYADTHPSIGNYFMLTTGQIVTNDDGYSGTVDVDNVVRRLLAAGKTWKSYAESLPYIGYGGQDVSPYAKRHNPFAYFTDVLNSQSQLNNLVPFTQFALDLSKNQLPQFSFIVPNLLDDAHDGSLAQADNWLQTNIDPLITSSTFQNDGLLVIVFDESFTQDVQHGGGQVPAVIISPKVKKGYQSTALYQHQSTCQLLLQALGLTAFPGAAQSAPSMREFF